MQRKRHRFSFPEEQLRQLKNANEKLRRLNHAALSQLQPVANSYLTSKQYRAASDSFEILALRMNSVVQFRDGIITAARAEPDVILVTFGLICDSCEDPLDEPQDHVPEVLKLDGGQLAEIDCLVELAQHTEERVSARCMSRGNLLKAFITGLGRLTRALLRQRRHLLDSAPEQNVRIEVEQDRSDRCIHCNKPVAVDQQKGSTN